MQITPGAALVSYMRLKPLGEYDWDAPVGEGDLSCFRSEYVQHFGLPYVDFVGASIPKCKGSHPTAQGMSIMAERIYNTCKDYLQ